MSGANLAHSALGMIVSREKWKYGENIALHYSYLKELAGKFECKSSKHTEFHWIRSFPDAKISPKS